MSISAATAERAGLAARTLPIAALWLVTAGCLIWAAIRVCGLDRAGGALVLLIPFTPYVAGGTVIVLVAALMLRAWWPATVAGVAVIALLACVVPRFVADRSGDAAENGPRLRVLSSNMFVGAADAQKIIDLVRTEHVDLLAVQEFTPDAAGRLDAAGVADVLPYRVSHPHPGVEGSGIFSRYPLRDDGLRVHPSGMTQARATVSVPGAADLAVESVHPCAPWSPAQATCWRTDLANEPAATPHGEPRLLLGDFNATLDHAPLRHLIATGYRDAADVRGTGLSGTWPFDGQLIPPVTIDHILADRRIGVARFAVHPVKDSDHHAISAELILP
jgi:endonuclease/exonuclease/phosphatase family metal-dependent hydrolase